MLEWLESLIRPNNGDLFADLTYMEQSSGLCSLPGELLAIIANYLSTSSEAYLVLTCKHLKMVLGSCSVHSVYGYSEDERACFLKMISRDLPYLHFCHEFVCFQMQKEQGVLRHTGSRVPLWFSYAQLAMKTCRLDPDFDLSLYDRPTALCRDRSIYSQFSSWTIQGTTGTLKAPSSHKNLIIPSFHAVQSRLLFKFRVTISMTTSHGRVKVTSVRNRSAVSFFDSPQLSSALDLIPLSHDQYAVGEA